MNPLFKERRGKSDMPYIRTKAGRIIKNPKVRLVAWREDVNDEWKTKETDLLEGENGLCLKEEIIKQADTIKELCDSWILVDRDNVQPIAFNINDDNIAKTYKDNKDKHNFTLFAAIWVFDSNGTPTLKPLAKMNENGDLELL